MNEQEFNSILYYQNMKKKLGDYEQYTHVLPQWRGFETGG